jgi:hypothetical protein
MPRGEILRRRRNPTAPIGLKPGLGTNNKLLEDIAGSVKGDMISYILNGLSGGADRPKKVA